MNAFRMLPRLRPVLICHGHRRLLDVATRSRQPARFAFVGSSAPSEPGASESSSNPESSDRDNNKPIGPKPGSKKPGSKEPDSKEPESKKSSRKKLDSNDRDSKKAGTKTPARKRSGSIKPSSIRPGGDEPGSKKPISKDYRINSRGTLLTLAIETSCDDTCVALLEKERGLGGGARVLFHQRQTADNSKYGGINPLPTVESHNSKLAKLIDNALCALPQVVAPDNPSAAWAISSGSKFNGDSPSRLPDFVSVTRGPGITMALSAGLSTAKGLATAWKVPLVGVHHMQAHLLTPRLMSALQKPFFDFEKEFARNHPYAARIGPKTEQMKAAESGTAVSKPDPTQHWAGEENVTWPRFSFSTLLVSGGHTMLVHSRDLVTHRTLAEVEGFAAGDALDKCARAILPADYHGKTSSFARLLDEFVFQTRIPFRDLYAPPSNRAEEVATVAPRRHMFEIPGAQRSAVDILPDDKDDPRYPWALSTPLAGSSQRKFAFGGILEQVLRIVKEREAAGGMDDQERRVLGFETMRVMFEHLGSRSLVAMEHWRTSRPTIKPIPKEVIALPPNERKFRLMLGGGVASNKFLRYVLRSMAEARGFREVHVIGPPAEMCTDNAAMIAWAGMEMYEAGYTTDLSVLPRRKWPLDNDKDGGILGGPDDCWIHPKEPIETEFLYDEDTA
ncbi:uncharacterized protein PgNI_11738 [Pyricularia grisea]|uniref:Gcp-like domain-containing protein n=1 Tax=Pyricularia grisea TaxID=148305 RepID=A0A6P8ANI8_PYRGI|nr:uncharacterized protein PgNI_11738 [Pyricularia grisea]TLD03581.1 hypothetical protein PgNI_11738 [Pyricularia grisea]